MSNLKPLSSFVLSVLYNLEAEEHGGGGEEKSEGLALLLCQ